MLPMKYIPQLIGHTFSIAYLDIYIVVGVAIYPVIDAAILDVVFQFNRESSVSLAFGKLGALHLEGWDMMGYDNFSSGLSCSRLKSAKVRISPLKMIRRKSLTTCSV